MVVSVRIMGGTASALICSENKTTATSTSSDVTSAQSYALYCRPWSSLASEYRFAGRRIELKLGSGG